MLILHQFEISPFCDKIRRIMHWKGLEYQVREYPLMSRKQIQAIYPAGKLPCLEHDGKFIGDSTDIAHYLEQNFPQKPLVPEQPEQAALVHIMEDWADESLYFYEMYLRFSLPENAGRNLPRMLENDKPFTRMMLKRLIPRGLRKLLADQGIGRKKKEQVLQEVDRHLDAVDKRLQGSDWLVGEQLSLADISVYSMVSCIRDSQQGTEAVQRRPGLLAWLQRIEDATGGKVPGSW